MAFVLAVSALLLVYNNLLNLLPFPRAAYVPANLALTAALLAAARVRGLTWQELGFSGPSAATGLRWGALIALGLAALLALALVVPQAARFLADRRVAGISGGELLYRTLARIPLGTAVLEEVAFRGVLFAALQRERSTAVAVLGSSLVFGLWHIGPALELLRVNQLAPGAGARAAAVGGAVLATAAGGVLFAALRVRTGGVTAPLLAHAAANALSTVAAFLHQRAL